MLNYKGQMIGCAVFEHSTGWETAPEMNAYFLYMSMNGSTVLIL
jgi:hypothetical protein